MLLQNQWQVLVAIIQHGNYRNLIVLLHTAAAAPCGLSPRVFVPPNSSFAAMPSKVHFFAYKEFFHDAFEVFLFFS